MTGTGTGPGPDGTDSGAGTHASAGSGPREGTPVPPGPVPPGRDLRLRPFPAISAADPAAQRRSLADLRAWAELGAEDAISWYLRDKTRKRTASRVLQSLAIAFAVAGTAVPLGAAATGSAGQGWGYVLFAVAAGCKGFDHFFGLSSAWMRDIGAAHALRGELNAVRLAWAADLLRAGPAAASADPGAPLDPAEVERQLALVARLVDAVRAHVEEETATWRAEFTAATRQLHRQAPDPAHPHFPEA